jgi:hypothetical protein
MISCLVLIEIQLFQSTAAPHTYMFAAKYRTTARRDASYFRDWCTPKYFNDAFQDFKVFFRSKTGYEWDYRLKGIRIKNMFVYTPPAEGRPVGSVPLGCEREEKEYDKDTSMDDVVYDTDSEVDDDEQGDGSEIVTKPIPRESTITINDSDIETGSDQGDNSDEQNKSSICGTTASCSLVDVSDSGANIFDEHRVASPPDLRGSNKFWEPVAQRRLCFLIHKNGTDPWY